MTFDALIHELECDYGRINFRERLMLRRAYDVVPEKEIENIPNSIEITNKLGDIHLCDRCACEYCDDRDIIKPVTTCCGFSEKRADK